MRTFTAVLMAGLMTGALALSVAMPAQAQSTRERRSDAERPRIRVTPTQRLVRQCEDWYEVEQRATGPTVVPASRCWWAYR
jgi:hypothetical protein